MEAKDLLTTRRFTKPLHYTLAYYVIVIVAITLFNVLPGFKSGPCTPNLDVLSIFLSFFGAVLLLCVNLIRLKQRGRIYLSSVIIHALVVLTGIIFLVLNP
ncbi:hypothetical protein D0C36_22130 [Mucilaginibacter conchicola]|uniref:Uncharacterized protein n=1 Tax=Mucilaginibacter conchicola TaxID=2303333 RepID=A0A372NNI5_9SPHI|nr:hypothetical protein [Mucilaginibacter conchicola]RFZ90484.1 hypothetical protein D0C36_22130 [Mucilaginibacter conchicola]